MSSATNFLSVWTIIYLQDAYVILGEGICQEHFALVQSVLPCAIRVYTFYCHGKRYWYSSFSF